jgi:penicillin-binding protein 2
VPCAPGHRPPTPGNTLHLSVDIRLQALVEQLFGDRRGALVALDPRNGEVLAFVSKPGFDPNLFVDGIDVESWRELNEDIDKPLLNRALRGTYPPGSTYKPFMAMAALQQRQAQPRHHHQRHPHLPLRRTRLRQPVRRPRRRHGHAPLHRRVEQRLLLLAGQRDGRGPIHEQLTPLGFGRKTEIDLPGEVTGVLPSTDWKRR